MDDYIAVYIYDVKRAIEEVESYFVGYPMRYDVFEKDYLRRSAVERKAEIMGEAINRILKIQRDFPLPNAKAVVDTSLPITFLHLIICPVRTAGQK